MREYGLVQLIVIIKEINMSVKDSTFEIPLWRTRTIWKPMAKDQVSFECGREPAGYEYFGLKYGWQDDSAYKKLSFGKISKVNPEVQFTRIVELECNCAKVKRLFVLND